MQLQRSASGLSAVSRVQCVLKLLVRVCVLQSSSLRGASPELTSSSKGAEEQTLVRLVEPLDRGEDSLRDARTGAGVGVGVSVGVAFAFAFAGADAFVCVVLAFAPLPPLTARSRSFNSLASARARVPVYEYPKCSGARTRHARISAFGRH